MPKYRYKSIDATGKLARGEIVAFNEAALEDKLLQNGLTLIKTKMVKEGLLSRLVFSEKIKPRLIIELYHRLSQTLELGLPLLSALEENAKILPSKTLKKTIEEIHMAVEAGNTLYESMSRFPNIFGKLELAIVRLGEETGVLPNSLKELADFLEWKEDIRSTIKRAAIYPSFIVIAIGGVVGVWVGYVLPQMAKLLIDMGVKLPFLTQMILSVSNFLQIYWIYLLGGIFGIVILLYLFKRTEKGHFLFDKYILKLPLIGDILLNIAVARMSHNFATMYMSGMSINTIFEILIGDVLGNRYLESKLKVVFEGVQQGESISSGFESAGGFPQLLLGAIRNGENTGTIDESFNRLGTYYDGEVKRNVETMINAMEPLSILLLGGVFGMIALSIMLPLYDVISEFK
jgi:type II secretory pathway component PulF